MRPLLILPPPSAGWQRSLPRHQLPRRGSLVQTVADHPVATSTLGAIEGLVGGYQEGILCERIGRKFGNTQAYRHRYLQEDALLCYIRERLVRHHRAKSLCYMCGG